MVEKPGISVQLYFERLLTEHDRRYEQRFLAQEKAIARAEETQERALVIAKREADVAGRKLEDALVAYKASQNEWQKTFNDYRESVKSETLSKGETLQMFDKHFTLIQKLEVDVSKIQNSLSRGEGGTLARDKGRQQSNFLVGIMIAIGLSLAGHVVTAVVYFLSRN